MPKARVKDRFRPRGSPKRRAGEEMTQGQAPSRVARGVRFLALVMLAACGPELALPADVPVRPAPVIAALEAGAGDPIPPGWMVAKRCRKDNEIFYPDVAMRFWSSSYSELQGHQIVNREDSPWRRAGDGWSAEVHENGNVTILEPDGGMGVEAPPAQIHVELLQRGEQLFFQRIESTADESPKTTECVLTKATSDEARAAEAALVVIEDPGNCLHAVECCDALGGAMAAHEEDRLSWSSICEKRETSPAYCHLWLVDRLADAREEGRTLPAQCLAQPR